MGRPYSSSQASDYGRDPEQGEWQSLRGELVALLDQVENQVARQRQQREPAYQQAAQPTRHAAEPEPEMRHREALRSVKRAVDRYSDRDDAYGRDGFGNPRDTLQSAISQIRARQAEPAPPMAQPQPPAPQPVRVMDSPRFDELAQAVGGISGRLERLEAELRSSSKSQTGNVKEIAEQVAQLSHVIELLAGAVGETGQVKRLETQIASLASLVSQGPRVDLTSLTDRMDELGKTVGKMMDRQERAAGAHRDDDAALTQRLDDVSSTLGRLADLQVQFANRVDNSAKASFGIRDGVIAIENNLKDGMRQVQSGLNDGFAAVQSGLNTSLGAMQAGLSAGLGTVQEGFGASMKSVEETVRSIYDRIDTLERGSAVPAADLEKISGEMAQFAEALKNSAQPAGLIEHIDALTARIGQIENSGGAVSGLAADVNDLRKAVADAVEPRFTAIEMQLGALHDRILDSDRRAPDISVGQLEAQVRQLVARMDQTGEQLTGLARMYQPAEAAPAPDYDAIADMVASRAAEAMATNHGPTSGMVAADLDEIERRMSRLLDAAQLDKPSDDLAGIAISINAVNERLVRLERSLSEPRADREPAMMAPPQPAAQRIDHVSVPSIDEPAARPAGAAADPIAPLLAEAAQSAMYEAQGAEPATMRSRPLRRDDMPANPSVDAPLIDPPFGDDDPVRQALEAKNGPRKRHPGLGYEGETSVPPTFDPETVARPPRPVSSFDAPDGEAFAATPIAMPAAAPVAETPSANTFIAAARRAAQRQQPGPKPGTASNSLIARAFASFQAGSKPAEDKVPAPVKPPLADKPAKAEKPAPVERAARPAKEKKQKKGGRLLAGDKQPRTEWKPEDEPAIGAVQPMSPPLPGVDVVAADVEATGTVERAGKKESFLSRHRRPILLAASVVAVALLALNLINQRMTSSQPAATATPAKTSEAAPAEIGAPLSAEPVSTASTPMIGPRVIPIVDSLSTASVDPAAARSFSPLQVPATPTAAFSAIARATDGEEDDNAAVTAEPLLETAAIAPLASGVEPMPEQLASPVKVDMPPDALGPEALRAAASNGDARAQFEIAAIYTEGRAIPEDLGAAAVWYERAAAQGFAPAQYRLGNLYENGRGVTKDLEQAKLWYQRAAEAGNRMAMHNLAALYAGGELGKQQFDAAAQWFQQAAERGMRDSQFNLGMLYARGLGVPQDLKQSYKWFSLAAARGDGDAAKARDDIAGSLDAATVGQLNDEVAAFKAARVDLVANFAPIGTWAPKFDPGETITDGSIVKSVQAALNALGYEVGSPDGVAGPKTAEAIRAFEKATGMTESGAVNPRLLAVLGSQPV